LSLALAKNEFDGDDDGENEEEQVLFCFFGLLLGTIIMSSSGGGGSGSRSNDGAAKHRKLVTAAINTDAINLLRKYHERGIDIFSCDGPFGIETSIFGAALLGRAGG
jgi:hypothetical protein